MNNAWRRSAALAASATASYIDGRAGQTRRAQRRKEREAEPKAKRKDKEEVKERVTPVPKPAAACCRAAGARHCPAAASAGRRATAGAPAQQPANNFQTARALILSGKYEAGIAAMKSLGFDDHPDVASSIGFAYAKLGNLGEARNWYNRALAADPNHMSTLVLFGCALCCARRSRQSARRPRAHQSAVRRHRLLVNLQELDRPDRGEGAVADRSVAVQLESPINNGLAGTCPGDPDSAGKALPA